MKMYLLHDQGYRAGKYTTLAWHLLHKEEDYRDPLGRI
jgi:hypothetical protein